MSETDPCPEVFTTRVEDPSIVQDYTLVLQVVYHSFHRRDTETLKSRYKTVFSFLSSVRTDFREGEFIVNFFKEREVGGV